MYEADVRDGVLRLHRSQGGTDAGSGTATSTDAGSETATSTDAGSEAAGRIGVAGGASDTDSRPDADVEWLSTGANGGRSTAPAAYNVSVPEGWPRTDLAAYGRERLDRAEFASGPTLFTGASLDHARVARCRPVTVAATAGISNPAALPMEPEGGDLPSADPEPVGTVNLLVGTTRALDPGALANLLTVAAEAKAATLLELTGFPGTTTDAVVVGHDPAGPDASFTGSATPVGAATRAGVREAVTASLRSWATDGGNCDSDAKLPDSVADADYGVSTDVRATVAEPDALE